MTYFIELMKHLRTLIERGSKVPLSSKVIIDANKCLMILDEMDNNLPDAIQYGIKMYSEQKRILGSAENEAISRVTSAEMKANKALENARRDAERIVMDAEDEAKAILDDANERAEHMVNEDEIVRPGARGGPEHQERRARVGRRDAPPRRATTRTVCWRTSNRGWTRRSRKCAACARKRPTRPSDAWSHRKNLSNPLDKGESVRL